MLLIRVLQNGSIRPYGRAALISAGCSTSPVLLPQLLRVYVITAARSGLDSCVHGGIGVPGLPLSTIAICPALGPLTIFEPSSAGNAPGTPLPLAWWQA